MPSASTARATPTRCSRSRPPTNRCSSNGSCRSPTPASRWVNDAISRRSTGKATTRTRRTTKKHGKTIYPTEPPDHHTQIHKSRIPYPEYMSLKILHHRHIRQGVPLHRKKSDSRRIYANPHTDRNLKRTVNKALEAVDLILRTSNNGVFF